MGLIISRFRRKKTTIQALEQLETRIKSIERDGESEEQTHKRVLAYIMVNSVGLYIIFGLVYYYLYVGNSQYWLDSVMYASPLLLLPVLVIFLRGAVSWYYQLKLKNKRTMLRQIRAEKKQILEDVMNKETYKIAKDILDKYGTPEDQSKVLKPLPAINSPVITSGTPRATGEIRQRMIMQNSTPVNKNMNVLATNMTPMHNNARFKKEQLPHPVPDRNRSAFDKVVDYLLKDGPNYRMALICTECFSHNGMAMIEEFEYVSYKCAYCGTFNCARKQRPAAPVLSPNKAITYHNEVTVASDDSSLASSASDTEDEQAVSIVSSDAPGSDSKMDPLPSSLEGDRRSPIIELKD